MIKKTFDAQAYDRMRLKTKAFAGQTTTPADGGETIPTPLAAYYMDLLRDSSIIRQLSEEIRMSAATLEIPRQLTGNTLFVVGEGSNMRTEGGASGSGDSMTKATFDSITLTNYKLGVFAGYTTELAEDSLIDVARMVITNGALALAEGEEMAFIWGSTNAGGGEIGAGYTAGQPSLKYSGVIQEVPYASNAGVVPIGMGWTSPNTSNRDHVIDATQALLTFNHLNNAKAIIEDVKGNGKVTDFLVPPKIVARMRNPVEFDMFQSLDKIGNKAALITGAVGDFYGSGITPSGFLPTGDKTASAGYPQNASGTFVDGATDGMILGFDRRALVIGQRRDISARSEHILNDDVEVIRWLERVAFKVRRPEWLVLIGDVKNEAS